jgi:hypothetical protein
LPVQPEEFLKIAGRRSSPERMLPTLFGGRKEPTILPLVWNIIFSSLLGLLLLVRDLLIRCIRGLFSPSGQED